MSTKKKSLLNRMSIVDESLSENILYYIAIKKLLKGDYFICDLPLVDNILSEILNQAVNNSLSSMCRDGETNTFSVLVRCSSSVDQKEGRELNCIDMSIAIDINSPALWESGGVEILVLSVSYALYMVENLYDVAINSKIRLDCFTFGVDTSDTSIVGEDYLYTSNLGLDVSGLSSDFQMLSASAVESNIRDLDFLLSKEFVRLGKYCLIELMDCCSDLLDNQESSETGNESDNMQAWCVDILNEYVRCVLACCYSFNISSIPSVMFNRLDVIEEAIEGHVERSISIRLPEKLVLSVAKDKDFEFVFNKRNRFIEILNRPLIILDSPFQIYIGA